MKMYIDWNNVEPLDVLLFGDAGKPSKLIRYATAATYSHAGIITTEDTIFEAVPGGLGHRPYTTVRDTSRRLSSVEKRLRCSDIQSRLCSQSADVKAYLPRRSSP